MSKIANCIGGRDPNFGPNSCNKCEPGYVKRRSAHGGPDECIQAWTCNHGIPRDDPRNEPGQRLEPDEVVTTRHECVACPTFGYTLLGTTCVPGGDDPPSPLDLREDQCPSGMHAAPRQNPLASSMGWYSVNTTINRKHPTITPGENCANEGEYCTPQDCDLSEIVWDRNYRWNCADYEAAKAFEKTVRDGKRNPDYCLNVGSQRDADWDGNNCYKWYNPDTLEICNDTDEWESGDCKRMETGNDCCPFDCGHCISMLSGVDPSKTSEECERPREKLACLQDVAHTYEQALAGCKNRLLDYCDIACEKMYCPLGRCDDERLRTCFSNCRNRNQPLKQCVEDAESAHDRGVANCSTIRNPRHWVPYRGKCPKCTEIVGCENTRRRAVMHPFRNTHGQLIRAKCDEDDDGNDVNCTARYPKCEDIRWEHLTHPDSSHPDPLTCNSFYELDDAGLMARYCKNDPDFDFDDDYDHNAKPCVTVDGGDETDEGMVDAGCHDRCTSPAFLNDLALNFSYTNLEDAMDQCRTYVSNHHGNPGQTCSADQLANICDWIVGGNQRNRCTRFDSLLHTEKSMCHAPLTCSDGRCTMPG